MARLDAATSAFVTAKVHVESIFELSVDRSDVDFFSMKPGTESLNKPDSGIKVTTKSNAGLPWQLGVDVLDEFRSGVNTIPAENLTWTGWTTGAGHWFGTGKQALSLASVVAYASAADESVNIPKGTDNFFKFSLHLPEKQAPGDYRTVIRFTLTQ